MSKQSFARWGPLVALVAVTGIVGWAMAAGVPTSSSYRVSMPMMYADDAYEGE
jgi:hypothetical protein